MVTDHLSNSKLHFSSQGHPAVIHSSVAAGEQWRTGLQSSRNLRHAENVLHRREVGRIKERCGGEHLGTSLLWRGRSCEGGDEQYS